VAGCHLAAVTFHRSILSHDWRWSLGLWPGNILPLLADAGLLVADYVCGATRRRWMAVAVLGMTQLDIKNTGFLRHPGPRALSSRFCRRVGVDYRYFCRATCECLASECRPAAGLGGWLLIGWPAPAWLDVHPLALRWVCLLRWQVSNSLRYS